MKTDWVYYESIDYLNTILEDYILVTTSKIHKRFKEKLSYLNGDIAFLEELPENFNKDKKPLVAFGGGSVIDKVKYMAKQQKVEWVSVPSALSHDGVCNSVAVLEDDTHVNCRTPLYVIFDYGILESEPQRLLVSGFLDILANKNSLEDCELAERYGKRENNALARIYSMSSYKIVDDFKNLRPSREVLKKISYAIVMSGLSENTNRCTRTISGSEHLIAHSIDFLYPENEVLHGFKVAYGCLLIEKLKKKSYFKRRLKNHGLYKVIKDELNFVNRDKVLAEAKELGKKENKFTYLDVEGTV